MARAGPPTADQRLAGLLRQAPLPLSPKGSPEPPGGLWQQWACKIKLIRQLCFKALFCQHPLRLSLTGTGLLRRRLFLCSVPEAHCPILPACRAAPRTGPSRGQSTAPSRENWSPVGMGPWRADPTRWYTPGACGPETRAGVSSRKGGRSSVQTMGAGREEGPGSSYGSAQAQHAPPRPLFRETRPPQGRHTDPLTQDRHSPKDPPARGCQDRCK